MDSDRPPERWSWLDAVGWLCGLWPALKERLHRWLHDSLPDCPYCAEWRDNADEWAEKCRAEEAAHKATVERPMVPPGTPVLGGPEEGIASWPVGDADLAVDSDTLLTGQRSRLPQRKSVAPELSQEPREPERPLPPIMQSATARRIAKETGIPTCRAAMIEGAGCTRKAGPALTTAELLGFGNDSEGCAKVAALRPLRKQPVAPTREAEA